MTLAALASVTRTEAVTKANISKTFGQRKADEYIKDDKFWSNEVSGQKLRSGSREAALVLLAARKS